MDDKIIHIELPLIYWKHIGNVLQKQPFEEVYEIIGEIQSQINEQTKDEND